MWKIASCLMLACGAVQASNWKPITSGPNAKIFVDLDSISRNGKFKKAWFWYGHDIEQEGNAYSQYKKWQTSKNLEYFSCEERTSSTLQVFYYTEKGEFLGSYNLTLANSQFYEVAPDTIGEEIFKFMCKK